LIKAEVALLTTAVVTATPGWLVIPSYISTKFLKLAIFRLVGLTFSCILFKFNSLRFGTDMLGTAAQAAVFFQ
jgi:hypothetical protein